MGQTVWTGFEVQMVHCPQIGFGYLRCGRDAVAVRTRGLESTHTQASVGYQRRLWRPRCEYRRLFHADVLVACVMILQAHRVLRLDILPYSIVLYSNVAGLARGLSSVRVTTAHRLGLCLSGRKHSDITAGDMRTPLTEHPRTRAFSSKHPCRSNTLEYMGTHGEADGDKLVGFEVLFFPLRLAGTRVTRLPSVKTFI